MNPQLRLPALRRFATAISILTILGHTVLGFETSWAQVVVALLAAYGAELLLEAAGALGTGQRPRFLGGPRALVEFLLSAHITGLAVAMLLYGNDRLMPFVFAAVVAIASKAIFRAPIDGGMRHVFNPSNTGITVTLLCFPWVGIAPPYQFTEGVAGVWDWVVPGIVVFTGTFLNARFTHRIPVVLGWVLGFVAQALGRSLLFGTAVGPALLPMSGMAFLLFTFYMVTDPSTTPDRPRAQAAFGAAVALVYGILQLWHVVFGLFFALTIVCAARGILLHALALRVEAAPEPVAVLSEAREP